MTFEILNEMPVGHQAGERETGNGTPWHRWNGGVLRSAGFSAKATKDGTNVDRSTLSGRLGC